MSESNKERESVNNMNFVFWLLVIIALIILWFLLAFTFRPIGRFFYRVWKDAIEEIEKKDEDKEN